jgi:hypothetical protein
MSITFRRIETPAECARWNALAAGSAGHRHQCLWWMEPLQRYGFRIDALGCWRDGRLIGGALFRTYTVPLSPIRVTECLDGPVFLEWSDAWAGALVTAVADLAEQVDSTVVNLQDCPRVEVQQSVLAAFRDGGRKMALKPGLPDAILPLRGRSIDEIWKGFNHGTRQRIRKARSGQLVVRRLTEPGELARAYDAWIATAQRKSFSEIRPWGSLEPVLQHCLDQGLGSVLASFKGDELVAAVLVTHVGSAASYVYGGYVDGGEKLSPTQVLHDEAIRECVSRDLAGYNFGALLAGTYPEARGVDEFKLGFGAVPQPHTDTISWLRKPVLYASMERLRRGWLGRNLEARLRKALIRKGEPSLAG